MYIQQKKKSSIQYAIFIRSVIESMALNAQINLATLGLWTKTYLAEAIKWQFNILKGKQQFFINKPGQKQIPAESGNCEVNRLVKWDITAQQHCMLSMQNSVDSVTVEMSGLKRFLYNLEIHCSDFKQFYSKLTELYMTHRRVKVHHTSVEVSALRILA